MIVQHNQTGQDGVGAVKTLTELTSVRLKAKEVTTIRKGTLKITGDRSAATWTIEVVVSPGTAVTEHYPPAVILDPPLPAAPTANFTWDISPVQ